MISINTKINFNELEKCAAACRVDKLMQLATQLPTHNFGTQAALVQLLITWAAHSGDSTLVTHVQQQENADEYFRNLVSTDHGLIAVLLANRIQTAARHDVTAKAKSIAGKRYSEFNRVEIRGGRLSLIVADNHPYAPRAAPFVALAEKDPQLRARRKDTFLGDFRYHLAQCFRTTGSSPLRDGDFRRVLEVIYELFANTEEWGTSDIAFVPLTQSVRGVLAQIVPAQLAQEHVEGGDMTVSPSFKRYIRSVSETDKARAAHFFQVSIFERGG